MARPKTRDAELARRFVDSAVGIVSDAGAAALTTRRAAAEAGSNIAALNDLFGSRDGLVDAVMAAGFERLAEVMRARSSDPTAARLREFAWAYREFAQHNPTLVDVMFARPLSSGGSADLTGAWECRALLTDAVRDLLPDADSADIDAAALGVSALIEGLALNERHGLLGGPGAADRVWVVALDAMIAGL